MSSSKTIQQWVDEYLVHRRALGFEDISLGKMLLHFSRYAHARCQGSHITKRLSVEWAMSSHKAGQYYRRRLLGYVRGLAQYVAIFDTRTEIPESGLLGYAAYRRTPYIYTDDEILRMIREAGSGKNIVPFWRETFPAIIGLIACTGIRVGEALKLRHNDVDLVQGHFLIRESKCRSLRRVMIHDTTVNRLERYIALQIPFPRHGHPTFFRRELGMPIGRHFIEHSFRYLRIRAKLASPPGRRAPRLYDLRHTFACHQVMTWHRDKKKLDELMPALSAHLGHSEIDDTYWYLTATPELLAVCSRQMEHFADKGGAL